MPSSKAVSPYDGIRMSDADRAFCVKLWAPPPEDRFASVGRCASTGKEVTICYNVYGDAQNPCMLLIMGLGCPAPYWDSRFCHGIAKQGFFVIRYDNRDVGLSTHFDGFKAPFIVRLGLPRWLSIGEGKAPYTLKDMAADAVGLLDHLNVESAHIVGCSMGGMIAQEMILDHPDRVRSLCLHSTSSGVPLPKPHILLRLLDKPKNDSVEEVINQKERFFSVQVGNYEFPRYEFRLGLVLTHNRCNYEAGHTRHLTAIARGGDRTAALREKVNPRTRLRLAPVRGSGYTTLAKDIFHWALSLLGGRGNAITAPAASTESQHPTATTAAAAASSAAVTAAARRGRSAATSDIPILVIHGGADPIIPVENGKKLANTLAGAKLVILPDMGHYFTSEVYKALSDEMVLNARKAESFEEI